MESAQFCTISLAELEALESEERDRLPFGVIGFDRSTIVETYNATEATAAGLNPARVVGTPFFDAVAQCMNNYMVAQRFEDEPELDAILPYVLTLRMRPTRVRLRLLQQAGTPRRYILVER